MGSASSSRAGEPPPALAALAAWLREAGFTEQTVAEGGGFGNRQVAYTRSPLVVTMTSDRGAWTLDVGHEGWPDEGYDLDLWSAALDQTGPPPVPSSLEVQADALRERLGEIAAQADLREQLSAIGEARIRRRLGLDP
jgi:hypothetical protein